MAYIVLNSSLAKTKLAAITLFTNKIPFTFIIDTGCNISLIDKAVVETFLDTAKVELRIDNLNGLSSSLDSNGIITQSFVSGVFKFEHTFAIADLTNVKTNYEEYAGSPVHGILGTDFLIKYKCHLDFKKNRLHLG